MGSKQKKNMTHKIGEISQSMMNSLAKSPVLKGAVPAMAGSALTFLQHIEIWLRISGAFVGLVIGVLTLYTMIKNLRKK
jgi:hypothetical protein